MIFEIGQGILDLFFTIFYMAIWWQAY